MCGEGPKGIPRRDRAFNAKCGGRLSDALVETPPHDPYGRSGTDECVGEATHGNETRGRAVLLQCPRLYTHPWTEWSEGGVSCLLSGCSPLFFP
jgi:hypothetical protein